MKDLIKAIKELKADLFYQIESKHGAEKARQYPSILLAEDALKNMDSSSRIIDRRELLEDYTRNLKHQGVAIFTEEGVRICVDNYESSNSL